ncbi:hypothetical protein SUGI_0011630 [Cryptomeria japonica]|nr:hypothetical protein SUGI_0011630 [Cryptomeria japonica]
MIVLLCYGSSVIGCGSRLWANGWLDDSCLWLNGCGDASPLWLNDCGDASRLWLNGCGGGSRLWLNGCGGGSRLWLNVKPTLCLSDVSSYILEPEPKSMYELKERVIVCFDDLLASCVQAIPEVLVEYSNQWARELEEEKISKALEVAAKVTQLKKMIDQTEKDERNSEDIEVKTG